MIVRLSISSSNDRLPKGYSFAYQLLPFLLFLCVLVFFELHLRGLGWQSSLVDSVELWSSQRKRASDLEDQALILLGASRIQLGLDLEVAREATGLQPVQLAINGSPFIPVLKNLASDESVTGTLIIGLSDYISIGNGANKAEEWVEYYRNEYRNGKGKEPYKKVNSLIKSFFDEYLVTRLSGAKPATIISSLAFKKRSYGNYLKTNSDRSIDADYKKVRMPHFYFDRVERNFGSDLFKQTTTYMEFLVKYNVAIEKIEAVDKKNFLSGLDVMLGYIKKIESRGGKVILVRFPTDKLIWEMDKKRYPRNNFWNEIAKRHISSIHFQDYPELSSYTLPDGSHLDYRDKKSFTSALMSIVMKQ